MRRAVDFSRIARYPQPVRRGLVGRIHYHYSRLAVRIEKGRGEQLTTTGRTCDSLRTGFNERREVPDVVVRTQVSQLARLRISMHRRETEVLNMIWTTALVEQNIPVSPTNRAVVEVVDHRPPVLFTKLPFIQSLRIK